MQKIAYQILEKAPQWLVFLLGGGLMGVIGALDYFLTIDIALSFFYLFPIILVSWFGKPKYGFFFSIVAAFLWLIAALHTKVYSLVWLPYWNALVRLGVFIVVSYLLWQLKDAYELEKKLARTDHLTGIVNRHFFWTLLTLESQRSQRYRHPLTLAYFDVDNFKTINDRWGHQKGDEVLQIMAGTVCQQLRSTDTFARLGGDEFALLLPETNYLASKTVLDRIQLHFSQIVGQYDLPISLSIGAITFYTLPERPEEMVDRVDRLMYSVKKTGKNAIQHEVHPPEAIVR